MLGKQVTGHFQPICVMCCVCCSAGAYSSIDVKLGAPQDLFSFQDSTFESFELELDDLGTDENVCSEMQSLNGPNQSSFTL